MIELTRLNGEAFVLNAELIETIAASPDTVVTLIRPSLCGERVRRCRDGKGHTI